MGNQFFTFFNDFQCFSLKIACLVPKIGKKCFQENVMFELREREKNFCAPPDASDCFGKVVWDLGYLQNQTE